MCDDVLCALQAASTRRRTHVTSRGVAPCGDLFTYRLSRRVAGRVRALTGCKRAGSLVWGAVINIRQGRVLEATPAPGSACDWGGRLECTVHDDVRAVATVTFACIAAYFVLYAFYLLRAWRQLSRELYQKYRLMNMILRLQVRPPQHRVVRYACRPTYACCTCVLVCRSRASDRYQHAVVSHLSITKQGTAAAAERWAGGSNGVVCAVCGMCWVRHTRTGTACGSASRNCPDILKM